MRHTRQPRKTTCDPHARHAPLTSLPRQRRHVSPATSALACVNSKIITWFSDTTVSSIHSLFTPFETAKEVWDYLAERYSSVDGANEYQLGLELHHLCFDSDRSRLHHFLMALSPDYEHIRASLLHHHPLPTVGQALADLRSEETRKKTMVYQHSQPVLETPVWAPLQPPS
ncbi:hypothetical protein Acr_12g0001360 [Actinidia rufa]|uniref:Uncharacterized protein n=1 Tax=Actinidia rufa TaxID=165716 RepID=A0A7J0FG07_9ERIC|nr:hypothetical protein Acr_12g0001360 [Actinidia rufa]